MVDIAQQKQQAAQWFKALRDDICSEFEKIEEELGSKAKFARRVWQRNDKDGGGGETSVMHGEVFEKVGVNFSEVNGEFAEKFAKEIPGAENDPSFWASGISLVAHMKNPKVPAVHMNTRMIVTSKQWFGGGADLTPTIEYAQDNQDFHQAFKAACDKTDPSYYPKFKEECDRYFFLPHRNETRGVGGIFYDYLNSGDFTTDLAFTKDVGLAFRDIFPKLVRRRYKEDFSPEDKTKQLIKRGRYAEFNLLYDRGTKFGLMTGGDTEAILMSLPPHAIWT
jgi:coproporphyrinogen III oxidase